MFLSLDYKMKQYFYLCYINKHDKKLLTQQLKINHDLSSKNFD